MGKVEGGGGFRLGDVVVLILVAVLRCCKWGVIHLFMGLGILVLIICCPAPFLNSVWDFVCSLNMVNLSSL